MTRPRLGEATTIRPTKPVIGHLWPGYFRYFEWRAYRLSYPPGPRQPLGPRVGMSHRYLDFAERLPNALTLKVYTPVFQGTRWLRASLREVSRW